jgi:hypothetical protein
VAFALFHIGFWKLFDWKTDLKSLSFANSGVIQILNLRLIYIFFFTAFICFVYPEELLHSKLGNALLIGNSLFWLGRTIEQFIFLRANNFKIHILSLVFIIGAIMFALPFLMEF